VPVVPAHIEGAHNILAKGKFMPRPGIVTVRFGEPIRFKSDQFDPQSGRGSRRAAVELLEQRIHGLSRRPPAGSVIELPEGREEEPPTISISAVAQGGRKTRNHAPRRGVGVDQLKAEHPRDI
jgi:hypothetical protein